MENETAITTILKYQCRHDARRRFMRPNSCQKAPLRDMDGKIRSECLVCAGPLKLTRNVKETTVMDKTKTEVEEILGDISLNPSEPAKLNIPLPKAQMCACGRGYAEPRANGWKGKCQECKKEHKQKALGISPKKPTSRETAPIKLCKYCGEPAVISKAGKSIGLCQGCNNAKIAKMNAARQQVKATQAATVPKQPKPAKVEQAPQCEKSFTEALLNQLLQDLHEYAQSLEPGAAVSLCMARIIINGENLYKIFKKEWSL